jgi:hypothetical protein
MTISGPQIQPCIRYQSSPTDSCNTSSSQEGASKLGMRRPAAGVNARLTTDNLNRLALGALPDAQRGAREQRRLGPALHAGCAADPGRRNPHGLRPRPKGRPSLGEALPERVRLAWPAALCFVSRLSPILSRASSYVRRGKPSFTSAVPLACFRFPRTVDCTLDAEASDDYGS